MTAIESGRGCSRWNEVLRDPRTVETYLALRGLSWLEKREHPATLPRKLAAGRRIGD